MTKKRRLLFIILPICLAVLCMGSIVLAAYYSRGSFKGVFVNRQEYFKSDVMSNNLVLIESSGMSRDIFIYNHDPQTGDYNSFDLTYDIYAWTSKSTGDKEYRLTFEDGTGVVVEADPDTVVKQGLVLKGGKRSTYSVTIDFPYAREEDLTDVPTLIIRAVPTSPARMTSDSFQLEAEIKPSLSNEFRPHGSFEHKSGELIGNYAAFIYRVSTEGNAPDDDREIEVSWNAKKLTLKQFNNQPIESLAPGTVTVDEERGVGVIKIAAKSYNTDTLLFMRKPAEASEGEASADGWDNALDALDVGDELAALNWAELNRLVSVSFPDLVE